MKLRLTLVGVLSLILLPVFSQLKLAERTVLDTANIICTYRYTYLTDLEHPDIIKENLMILEIGDNVSKYYDLKYFLDYSLTLADFGTARYEEKSGIRRSIRKDAQRTHLYKNFPIGSITVVDRVPFNNYIFEDTLNLQAWKLLPDTMSVLGYECKKATTYFRGRNYTAWYAPDIPVSDGPWKFGGLPGLILRVEDERNHHVFEAKGLKTIKGLRTIYLKQRLFVKTSLNKFLSLQKEYMSNPAAFVNASGMIQGELPQHVSRSRPYNPIELMDE